MSDDDLLKTLFREAFPSVSAETRAKFSSILTKEAKDYKWLYAPTLNEHLSQGDIICSIPAFFFDGVSVKTSKEKGPAILLEHDCDMSIDNGQCRNSHYVFAPLLPYEQIRKKLTDPSAIENNLITHKIYFPFIPTLNAAYVADLNLIGSLDAQGLHNSLQDKTIIRVASLSHNGFFFLLAKLTIHFLRASAIVDRA